MRPAVSCFSHIGGNKWNCFLAHEQNITKFQRRRRKKNGAISNGYIKIQNYPKSFSVQTAYGCLQ